MIQILGCQNQASVDSHELFNQRSLTSEVKTLELLNFTYEKIKFKLDLLNKDVLKLQKKHKTIKEKLINELITGNVEERTEKNKDLQELLQITNCQKYSDEVIKALRGFTYENISEKVLLKAKEQDNVVEKDLVSDFIKISIECKVKSEFLTAVNEELYMISNRIDKQKSKICDLEQQRSTFSGDFKEEPNNEGLWDSILRFAGKNGEESDKLGLNSDELYGQLQDAGESSTIIFDDSEVCCNRCFWVI
ncbi:hypothetical protein SteCoe_27578 [Stentor coeruleus]|uniref:Uncharacterized protein n=1 Tax=Stentor coeruleus TaxID=5963 RepID=A0A1R2BA70_9CILI|nr:hypothetical protein SteCoe_27578 [Stentor coeruleus]